MELETGADTGKSELKRSVGLWGLSAIGIGGTIGTGIFFILSQAVPIAGPAMIWSFVLSAIVAGLTAVCYAELAGAVPVAGSSYSYAYTTLGEAVAVGVGACCCWNGGWPARPLPSAGRCAQPIFHQRVRRPNAQRVVQRTRGRRNLHRAGDHPHRDVLLAADPRCRRAAKTNAIMVAIKLVVLVMFIVIGFQGLSVAEHRSLCPLRRLYMSAQPPSIIYLTLRRAGQRRRRR